MNVLIVYAHPEPKSFDGVMRTRALNVLTRAGHAVQLSDLYDMRFKSVADGGDFTDRVDDTFFDLQAEQMNAAQYGTFTPDILAEQSKVLWAELILFQFPLWWYSVPAILKGWFDRVLAYGFAYGEGRSLAGRRAMLVLTTGGPPRPYTPEKRDAISAILEPIQRYTLHLCGLEVLPPFAIYGAANASIRQREHFLLQYTRLLTSLDQIPPLEFD
jgi:NAD(P)H dehydrogenase (quinone)